jgi:hypothetical protein
MTQAFNLAQLANNLNTSGQLDATDGLSGLVTNANLASSGTASASTFLRGDRSWATVIQRIVQVISTTSTTTSSTSSTTYSDAVGLTLGITPSSSSNKILCIANIAFAISTNDGVSDGFKKSRIRRLPNTVMQIILVWQHSLFLNFSAPIVI